MKLMGGFRSRSCQWKPLNQPPVSRGLQYNSDDFEAERDSDCSVHEGKHLNNSKQRNKKQEQPYLKAASTGIYN